MPYVSAMNAATVSGLTSFDHSNIIEGSFFLDPQSDEIVNKLTYVSGPEPSTGRFSNALRSMTDGGSVADYGETYEQPDIEIHPVRNPAVSDDVISRKLLRLRTEPIYGGFDTDLQGIDLALGQLIEITHDLALGAAGWVDHVVKVTGIILNPSSKGTGMVSSVLFESVNQTLVVQSIAGNGWTPVGLEASSPSTAGVVGIESTGTAKRVGSG